jgi:hypothetical protein
MIENNKEKPMTWWILIADAARAKIFSTKGAGVRCIWNSR